MSKGKSKKEVVAENDAQNDKIHEVSSQIQVILESNNMALQPFLIRTEYGDRPSVRLIAVNTETNDGQSANTGTDSESKDEVGAA